MRCVKPFVFLIFICALPIGHPAHACLNDRDTAREEFNKLPDVVQIITGRFERNPPLYYQMRIDRETKELAANPNLLPDYDDIAVAYDRLGQEDQAIAWMTKKNAHLLAYDPNNPDLKEQWYLLLRQHGHIDGASVGS